MKNIQFNSSFGKAIFSSTIAVSKNYVFENHINFFLKDSGKSIRVVGTVPTDKNFSQVSNKLLPGETYKVEIVPIIKYIDNCQQCLNHLKNGKRLTIFWYSGAFVV